MKRHHLGALVAALVLSNGMSYGAECRPAASYHVEPVSFANADIEQAIRTLVKATPLELFFSAHGLPYQVTAEGISGSLDEVLTKLGEQVGVAWEQRECRLLISKSNKPLVRPQGATAGTPMGPSQNLMGAKPTSVSPGTQSASIMGMPGSVPDAAKAPNVGGPWTLSPGTLYSAVASIARRYGYSIAEDALMNDIGKRLKYGETLPLPGKDIEGDFEGLLAAANARRIVLDIEIFTGNLRVVPRFYEPRGHQ